MPSGPAVVAIIAAFNEADIIDTVISDLVSQDIAVYFLDDGSTDGTAEIAERHIGNGVIGLERSPPHDPDAGAHGFAWERILCRKAQLARELPADWFIHHDADEFRESPWPAMSLRDGIAWVDRLGFNAIDFVCLDFWPDHDGFRTGHDVREAFTHFAPAAPYDRVQIRCWKKTESTVDLATSGGHEARFDGRRVFPVRFILRHYPIRGQTHGERKVFHERRFLDAERERGWHVQYDAFREGRPFLHDRAALEPYDPDGIRLSLTLHHRGVEELENALATARTELEARTRDLAARDRNLVARDRDLAARARDLAARDRELKALTQELNASRQALDARTAEVETLTGQIDRLRSEGEATRRELERHQSDLAAAARDLAHSRDQLAALSDEASALRSQLERQKEELTQTQSELAARTAEIDALSRHIEECRGVIDRLQHGCDDRGRELEAFRQSLSWRVTAPARAVYRILWRPKGDRGRA